MATFEELKHQGEDRFIDDRKPKEEDRRFLGKPHRIEAIVGTIFFLAIVPLMFSISTVAGMAYVVSIALALYRGLVFYEEGIVGYILAGVFLSVILGKLLAAIFPDLLPYAFISGIIMSLCAFFVILSVSSKLRR